MVEDEGVGQRHSALASQSRRAVLQLLIESAGPLDAAAIAARIGLHITTVRFHLEQLELAALIRRALSQGGARGRPRVLFEVTPAGRSNDGYRQLAEVLASALADDPDAGRTRAIAAGERWADASKPELQAASDGDAAVPLLRMLESVGFDPVLRTDADGRRIDLLACPFRDAAAAHPSVVCAMHWGLIKRTLENSGHDGGEASLLPFVEPQLCVVPLLQRASAAS